MGYSSTRKTSRWTTPSALCDIPKPDLKVSKQAEHLGLRRRAAWKLSSDEEHSARCKVCNKGKLLCKSWNKCGNMASKQKVSSSEFLRALSKTNEGWEVVKRLRRNPSGLRTPAPEEVARLRTISTTEETEITEQQFNNEVDISRYFELGLGFSDIGPLAEQQPPWSVEALQTETAVAMGSFQPWEDFISDFPEKVEEDLYDSDGLELSG